MSINAIIQVIFKNLEDNMSFPNIRNIEFENIIVSTVICKIVFIFYKLICLAVPPYLQLLLTFLNDDI